MSLTIRELKKRIEEVEKQLKNYDPSTYGCTKGDLIISREKLLLKLRKSTESNVFKIHHLEERLNSIQRQIDSYDSDRYTCDIYKLKRTKEKLQRELNIHKMYKRGKRCDKRKGFRGEVVLMDDQELLKFVTSMNKLGIKYQIF